MSELYKTLNAMKKAGHEVMKEVVDTSKTILWFGVPYLIINNLTVWGMVQTSPGSIPFLIVTGLGITALSVWIHFGTRLLFHLLEMKRKQPRRY